MENKTYMIFKRSSGEYETYRETVAIQEFKSPGAALDFALSKGMVITDDLEKFNRHFHGAVIMQGVMGKNILGFADEAEGSWVDDGKPEETQV